ncbi:hypothetical protein BLOT_004925 [Blomia tropicalis]|nr:hypothetical protein BLOT_004925 [Blomia tropicalis]
MLRNFHVYLSIIIGLHLLVKDVFNLKHSSETNNLKLTSTIDKLWNEFWEDYELFDDGFTSKDWISNRETVNSLPWINLIELRTLLWYCLGLQEFNDEFFIDRQFDIRLIHDLLTCTFRRATVENGPQLLI